jgi:hypothetical protein
LERAAEELMANTDLVKSQSSPQKGKRDHRKELRDSREELKGLAIHIEDCVPNVKIQKAANISKGLKHL